MRVAELCRANPVFAAPSLACGPLGGRETGALHVEVRYGATCQPRSQKLQCLRCRTSCNLHKADRTTSHANPDTAAVAFFNPRSDVWTEHFEWDDYTLVGKTEAGRVTIQALDLNHERRIKIRQAEQLFGLFPPDSVVK